MGTIIDMKEEDYFNLQPLDKLTIKLNEINSYEPTDPQLSARGLLWVDSKNIIQQWSWQTSYYNMENYFLGKSLKNNITTAKP